MTVSADFTSVTSPFRAGLLARCYRITGSAGEAAARAGTRLAAVLAGAVLAGAVLAGAVLAGAVLAGAVLAGTDRAGHRGCGG